jgi:hypothetical protein
MISLKKLILKLDNPDLIPEFKNWLIKEKNTVSRMSLHFLLNAAVSDARKSIKTSTYKMDFNPESAEKIW